MTVNLAGVRSTRPGGPGARVRVGVVAAAVSGVVSAAWLLPLAMYDPLTYVATTATATSVSTAGVLLVRDPEQRGTGVALIGVALLWLVSWGNEWSAGALPLLSQVLGPLWYVIGAYALLRYPHSRLQRRSELIAVLVLAVWADGGSVLRVLVGRPEWYGFSPDVVWPSFAVDPGTHATLSSVWFAGLAVLMVVLIGLLGAKLWRARGLGRVETGPTAVAAGSVAVSGIAYVAVHLVAVPERVHDLALVIIAGAVVAIPIAFLITVVRRHAARAAVADLVVTLADSPSVASIRAAMRVALRDPSLELYFWLPAEDGANGYVDDAHQPGPRAGEVPAERWAVEIADSDGQPLALLVTDPALRRHGELVSAAIGAGGLALSNGRLHQKVRAQLDEVRASRQRIVAAAHGERRRIERDLHDGAQQSLLAVSATLSAARLQVADRSTAAEVIARAQEDLSRAVRDLRDLARGIHPAVLTDEGLVPALERVAEGLALPTTIHAPSRRPAADVESTLYFAATEALTNVVRHADATHATITVSDGDGCVRLSVADDGRGGADTERGSGLSGLRDRVRALDGELTVAERPEGGTLLVAELPCA